MTERYRPTRDDMEARLAVLKVRIRAAKGKDWLRLSHQIEEMQEALRNADSPGSARGCDVVRHGCGLSEPGAIRTDAALSIAAAADSDCQQPRRPGAMSKRRQPAPARDGSAGGGGE